MVELFPMEVLRIQGLLEHIDGDWDIISIDVVWKGLNILASP